MIETQATVVSLCRGHYPALQAIYLFGSRAAGTANPSSDYDIALLLPAPTARQVGSLALSDLHMALEGTLGQSVDLVNLRQVQTVFAKEIIGNGERIAALDVDAADEFEAVTLSLYQKLNQERAAILADFERTGQAYAV